jgi:hypothetical protein
MHPMLINIIPFFKAFVKPLHLVFGVTAADLATPAAPKQNGAFLNNAPYKTGDKKKTRLRRILNKKLFDALLTPSKKR